MIGDEADGMKPETLTSATQEPREDTASLAPAEEAPDMADLFLALDTIGDSLASGMRLASPSPELLERLRSATVPGEPSPPDTSRLFVATRRGSEASPVSAAPQTPGEPRALEAIEGLKTLEARARACVACALSAARKNVVFGQGVPAPAVLVVGEGPGAEEDNQGLPFVGASGKLLDKMLASIGLFRDKNCYIANVVKCRPPNNREPAPDERAACMPFLREQIRLLKPKAILCAGRTAAQAVLGTTEGINRLRTRTHDLGGIPLVATYHPSALLRDESLKRPAWEDLKRLRDIVALGSGAHE